MPIALVTGAAKRIGRVIAEVLLEHGYHIIAHGHRSMDKMNEWIASHPRKDQVLSTLCADLSTEKGQAQLIDGVARVTQQIDIVIHNASVYRPRKFQQVSRTEFRSFMAINLEAPFFITQGLLPLLHRVANASVISIGDAMWTRPNSGYSHYFVTKAGLSIMTKALAVELAPRVRVNMIAPGAIIFPAFESSESQAKIISKIPFKRSGEAHDIARAIVFFHEKAPYVTGEIFCIDGGRSLV